MIVYIYGTNLIMEYDRLCCRAPGAVAFDLIHLTVNFKLLQL